MCVGICADVECVGVCAVLCVGVNVCTYVLCGDCLLQEEGEGGRREGGVAKERGKGSESVFYCW